MHKLEVKSVSHRVQKFIPQPPEKLLESLEENEQRLKERLDTLLRNLKEISDTEERVTINEQLRHTERELADVLDQRSLILSHIETEGIVKNENLVIVSMDPASQNLTEA